MTTVEAPKALAIMSTPEVRAANGVGTALIALTRSLDTILWANRAGAALLGLAGPGAVDGTPPPAVTALRQIQASARGLAAAGRARVLLRPAGQALGKPAVTDLLLLENPAIPEGFVLMSVEANRSLAERAEEIGVRLREEARDGDAPIAILAGEERLAENFPAGGLPGLAKALDAFRSSDENLRRVALAGRELTLARLGADHVAIRIDAGLDAPEAPVEDALEDVLPTETASAASAGFESFTVKRRPLRRGRGKMDMSALLMRWHSREGTPSSVEGPSTPAGSPAAPEPAAPDADEPQAESEAAAGHDASWQDGRDDASVPGPAEPSAAEGVDDATSDAPAPDAPAADHEPAIDFQAADAAADDDSAFPEDVSGDHPAADDGEVSAADDSGGEDPAADADTDEAATQDVAAAMPGDGDALHAELPRPFSTVEEPAPPALPPQEEREFSAADAGSVFEPRFEVAPVRFVWQIDREGRFRSLSPEFAAAVGPRAGAVIGRTFRDVAQVFGFDGDGEIMRLLERRDTWSGRSIEWPVENSDRKVPIDLAALPVYARDRSFDGFRGFGIVRMSETVDDPDRLGLVLAGRLPPTAAPKPGPEANGPLPDRAAAPADPDPAAPMDETREDRPGPVPLHGAEEARATFGKRAHRPKPAGKPGETRKIVDLEERRRSKDGVLSQAEEAAFLAIGQKLSDREDPEQLGRAVLEAAERARDLARQGESFGTDEGANAQDGAQEPLKDAAGEPVTPSSSATAAEPEASPNEGDADADADADRNDDAFPSETGGLIGDFDEVFADLPLPMLVQMREDLVYANREFCDLTGYPSIEALTDAGGLAHLFSDRDDEEAGGELQIRRANGSIVGARVHMQRATIAGRSCLIMSFSPSPMASLAGRGAGEEPDAAAHASAIEALAQEIEELRTVLNTATDGVVLLDLGGRIRSMNGAAHALFGIAEDDSAGRPFASLFAHESQKTALAYIETLREEGLAGILNDGREVIGRVAQGGFIPLFITIGRLTGDRGWCAVIRDIAHWKRIEEEMTEARRQAEAASLHKSQFLANISHELRTPLNAIIGFADVMSSECFGPIGHERYLEYLGDIKRSGHHVLDLVNDLLDISKIEAGKLELSFEAVSLNEVVAEVVALMQPQANRERVIVRSNLPSTVPPVVADGRSIRQIALNLVSNAIRFTPAGGQIVASTTYTGEGDVVLRFRDSGIGMTEREIELALMPFQQIRSTERNRGDGTGLGLPLTKAMAEANRAQFSITSTPGEGTVVEILFPSQRVLAD